MKRNKKKMLFCLFLTILFIVVNIILFRANNIAHDGCITALCGIYFWEYSCKNLFEWLIKEDK